MKPEHHAENSVAETVKVSGQVAPNDVFLLIASGFGESEQEPGPMPEPALESARESVVENTSNASDTQEISAEQIAVEMSEPSAFEAVETPPPPMASELPMPLEPALEPAPEPAAEQFAVEPTPPPSPVASEVSIVAELPPEPASETATEPVVEKTFVPEVSAQPLAEMPEPSIFEAPAEASPVEPEPPPMASEVPGVAELPTEPALELAVENTFMLEVSPEPVEKFSVEPIAVEMPEPSRFEAPPVETPPPPMASEVSSPAELASEPTSEIAPEPAVENTFMLEVSPEPVEKFNVEPSLAAEMPPFEAPPTEVPFLDTPPPPMASEISSVAELPLEPAIEKTLMLEVSAEPVPAEMPEPSTSEAPTETPPVETQFPPMASEASNETELPLEPVLEPAVENTFLQEFSSEPVAKFDAEPIATEMPEPSPVEAPPVETPPPPMAFEMPSEAKLPAVSAEIVHETPPPIVEQPAEEETLEEPGVLPEDVIEAIVTDFRAWLAEAKEIPPAPAEPDFDLATVVQHFTALRQDVNLQTKASRSQMEQNTQTSDLLRKSLETLREQHAQLQASETNVQDEAIRPLLKTLIDAHDALSLARREVQRQLDNMENMFKPAAPPVPTILPAPPAPPSLPPAPVTSQPEIPAEPTAMPSIQVALPAWARWLGLEASVDEQLAPLKAWAVTSRRWHEAARLWHAAFPAWHEAILAWHVTAQAWQKETQTWFEAAQVWHADHAKQETLPPPEDPAPRFRQLLEALLVGYQMSSQRIERALKAQGLETIACLGLPFDPETMEVVEVVREAGRTGTHVLEVVRNGYLWKDRVFRFAQVRVAKS